MKFRATSSAPATPAADRKPDWPANVLRFFGTYRQFFGRLPTDWTPAQVADGSSSLKPLIAIIDRDTYSENVMAAILEKMAVECNAQNANSKTPAVWQIKRRYCDSVGLGNRKQEGAKCGLCEGMGVVFVVCQVVKRQVNGKTIHTIQAIPNRDVIKAPTAFVNTVPCACDAGQRHNWTPDENGAKQETYSFQQRQAFAECCFRSGLIADQFAWECRGQKWEWTDLVR